MNYNSVTFKSSLMLAPLEKQFFPATYSVLSSACMIDVITVRMVGFNKIEIITEWFCICMIIYAYLVEALFLVLPIFLYYELNSKDVFEWMNQSPK